MMPGGLEETKMTKYHVHVYKIVSKAEIDIDVGSVEDIQNEIKNAEAEGKLKFSKKAIEEEMPDGRLVTYYVGDSLKEHEEDGT
jgi:hypothetical protein